MSVFTRGRYGASVRRKQVCINGPGHMTKMAAMAINSNNLLKSSLEPEGL